jgi:PadR family transcriptional regulator PadR
MRALFSAKAALLQALLTGPSYGMELLERIRDRTGGRVHLRPGSLYPALRALEREELVLRWAGATQRGRRRQYYELTSQGIRAAEKMRAAIRIFVGATPPSPISKRERSRMRERIRRCVSVSGFADELRRRTSVQRTTRQ